MLALLKLRAMGFSFHVDGDKVKYQFEGEGMPDSKQVAELLAELKVNKEAVMAYLREPEESTSVVWPGITVKIFRTRLDCMQVGHCRWMSNVNCWLAPVIKDSQLSGWCRERAKGGGKVGRTGSLSGR